MKTALAAVAALTLSATAATANWTGCRVGVGGTVMGSNTEVTGSDTLNLGITGGLDGLGSQEVGATLMAGCDIQMGSVVFGALADYTFHKNNTEAGINVPANALFLGQPAVNAGASFGFENTYTIGVRAGYLITPTTLASIHGGYAGASSNDLVLVVNGAEAFRAAIDDLKGWYVGAGLETQITPNITLGLTYRYIMFDSVDLPILPALAKIDLETEVNQVMATLSYRFGASDLSPMK